MNLTPCPWKLWFAIKLDNWLNTLILDFRRQNKDHPDPQDEMIHIQTFTPSSHRNETPRQ